MYTVEVNLLNQSSVYLEMNIYDSHIDLFIYYTHK